MPDPIVSLNEESLRADLRELVRRTVEEMLNGLLDEEADDLVGAERYERTADREAYRAGHYERRLTTTSGEVTIRMRRGHDPHAQAQGDEVHHGDHRALPAPGDLGRGGDDRDVPRGRLDEAHRGRERDPVGLECVRLDRLQPQREGLRGGGGMEEPPAREGLPLRLRGPGAGATRTSP